MPESPPASPFTIIVTVRDEHIDELNHVNNAVYLRWVQDVAVSHWQAAATPEMLADTLWVVLRHEIDYKSAAVLGDTLTVKTWVGEASRISFERHTEIYRSDAATGGATLVVKARTLWCPLDPGTRKPKRVDSSIRQRFSSPLH
jgi:acyl-CoA thioester hydrolase